MQLNVPSGHATMVLRGVFAIPPRGDSATTAPRTNALLTAIFVLGVVGFAVNAIFIEQARCAAGDNRLTRFGRKDVAECGSMLASFSCQEASPGTGSAIFDSTTCAAEVCTTVDEMQTVPASNCKNTAWSSTFFCLTASGMRASSMTKCEVPYNFVNLYNNFEQLGFVTCTGLVKVPKCKTYTSCEGLYYVCPPLFDRLGVASGYASVLFSVCATAFKTIVRAKEWRQAKRMTTQTEQAGAQAC